MGSLNNFTVISPNYNMGKYLAETIESVLVNLRDGDEYYIIDGGSTDESLDVIRRYEHRITGWISERDRGYADALAKGFERSSADYQCWINCGDFLLPGALDEARERLADPNVELIFGDDLYIDEAGNVLQVSNGYVAELSAMMLYGGWTPLQDACFWRRMLYKKSGGVNPLQRYAADYDLFLRMSLSGNCQYVPMLFSAFRQHGGQTSQAHAKGYRDERENCRRHELAQHLDGRCLQSIRSLQYWVKVRLRARFQSKNPELRYLIGKNVRDISCQPSRRLLRV